MTIFMKRIALSVFIVTLLSACAASESSQQSYQETKTMVMDILKTEDAQKEIEKIMKESEMKAQGKDKLTQMLATPQGQHIQEAVKNILTDPKYPDQLKKLMTDPKFAGQFAKAVQEENKQIHKELLKDPEYQALLLELMEEPEFQKLIQENLKSKAYRKEAMSVFEDAIQNPKFRLELMTLLKKAMEDDEQESTEKKDEGKGKGEKDKEKDEEKDKDKEE